MSGDGTERRTYLWNDGICPVCGDAYIEEFEALNAGQSYDAEICVYDEEKETADRHVILHLRSVDTATDRDEGVSR